MGKSKKILTLVLCVCVVVCCVFGRTYAEDGDMGLKAAIERVKTVIDVPEEYSQFDYRSYTISGGRTAWALEWNGDNGFLSATVDSEGTILEYFARSYTDSESNWATITQAEGKAMAEEFIKKVDRSLFDRLAFDRVDGYGSYTSYVYSETADNIKLNNRKTVVRVDRVNKKVIGYSSEGISKKPIDKISGLGLVSKADAVLKYAEKIGAKIVYRKEYDYKNKTISTYPVYVLNEANNIAISAVSGELVSYKSYEESGITAPGGGSINGPFEDMENSKAESDNVVLSPEELAAIETVSGLMSREQADGLIKKNFPELTGINLSSAGLMRDYYEKDKYYWNISYRVDGAADSIKNTYLNAQAKLDAKTGELLNWSYSDADYTYEKQVSEEEAKKIAHAFFDKFAKDKFVFCGDIQVSKAGMDYISYSFSAPRLENGAEVEGESISLTVNPDGRVTYFYNSFTNNLSFDSIEGAIDETAATEKLLLIGGFELIYVYTGEKYEPVYETGNKYIAISPLTGEEKKQKNAAAQKPDAYADINGHWAEDTVKALLDNGYFISGEAFEPDKPITVKEFLTYAQFVYGNDDNVKLLIEKIEPDKAQAGDINVNQTLTREIAAKYITANMGCDAIAEHSEIFIYPFADKDKVSDKLTGHIAICYAEKIFKCDENGNFNPSKDMTRAEAATVIFNYYSAR